MAANGSYGKGQEIRSKGKWKTTLQFCSNQLENRCQDSTRKHVTCYSSGYQGHFSQEYPRWNGSLTAPLGSSDGRQETFPVPEDQSFLALNSFQQNVESRYFLALNSYQQNVESRYRQDQMDGIITCLVCGEEGHYTCDCPMKDQEDKVICTLCHKKGHCCLWCCQQNKSENRACTRCGELGHSAGTNGLSCSSCDEFHPHGECRMSEVTCFICDSQDHYLAQCPLNSVLTAVCKDQRENFQAALRLALSKQGNTLSTPAKPSTESQVCEPSFAKKSAGKKPKSPRKCYCCGEEGHLSNSCPSKANKSNPKVRTGNATTGVLTMICLKCNEEGHYANQCPQKFGATSANLSRELEESSTIPTSSNLCKELEEHDPSTAKISAGKKPKSARKCVSCGEEGHRARSCPLKHQVLTIEKKPKSARKCVSCGEEGHMARSCPWSTRVLICYTCREEGHYSNQCSQKRQKR